MNGAGRDNSGGWGSGEEEEEEGNGKWLVAPRETAEGKRKRERKWGIGNEFLGKGVYLRVPVQREREGMTSQFKARSRPLAAPPVMEFSCSITRFFVFRGIFFAKGIFFPVAQVRGEDGIFGVESNKILDG